MRFENSIQAKGSIPLSDEQIQRVAPSIFAVSPHESRSSRFTAIPTINVLQGLRREGFEPFYAAQSRARDVGRREFTRHMLRLRQPNQLARVVGDVFPEVVITNANDGSSSYVMDAGMFRLVCLNGAVVGNNIVEGVHLRHTGDIVGRVIEGAYEVVKEFGRITDHVEQFQAITLSGGERAAFGKAALVAKYGEQTAYPVTVEQVLEARRGEDESNDLWTTFNVVQENVIRGGLQYRNAQGRRNTTRSVTGISQNVAINKALWTLAEEMAKLKAAA